MQRLKQRLLSYLYLSRVIHTIWNSSRTLLILNISLMVGQSLLRIVILYLFKLIIENVVSGLAANDPIKDLGKIAILLASAGGAELLVSAFRNLSEYVQEAQGRGVTDHMYDILNSKSIEVDLEYYENPQYQDTLHRAQQEVSFRPRTIVISLLEAGRSGISLLTIAGLLMFLHPLVAVVLFCSIVPHLIVRLRYSGLLYQWERKRTETDRKVKYFDLMMTDLQHAKELRLFSLGKMFLEQCKELRTILRTEQLDIIKRRSTAGFVSGITTTILIFGSYGFMAYQTLRVCP